jgi:hypothetical protein
MKKNENKDNHQGRILGRRLARELTRKELELVAGGVTTWTLTDPPDGPYRDKA